MTTREAILGLRFPIGGMTGAELYTLCLRRISADQKREILPTIKALVESGELRIRPQGMGGVTVGMFCRAI